MKTIKILLFAFILVVALVGCDSAKHMLADHYREKGVEQSNAGNLDKAVNYFEKAIKLYPNNSTYFEDLSIVYSKEEKYPKALEYINTAIVMNPEDSSHYKHRGYIRFYNKDLSGAVDDFSKVLTIEPIDKYRMLWLGIADEMLNKNNFQKLRKISTGKSLEEWPGRLISFYLGNINEDMILMSVGNNKEEQCEAYFFLGQFYLIKGQKDKARTYFQKSVDTDVKEFIEYEASLKELSK